METCRKYHPVCNSKNLLACKLLQYDLNGFNCVTVKCLLQEGDSEIAAKMQDLALAEGALPRHLHTAMYTQSTDSRLLTNR